VIFFAASIDENVSNIFRLSYLCQVQKNQAVTKKIQSDTRRKKNVFKAAVKVKPISMDCFLLLVTLHTRY
jgi:hypothetical protein